MPVHHLFHSNTRFVKLLGDLLFRPDEQPELDLENDYPVKLNITWKLIAEFQFCKKILMVHNLRSQTV